MQIGVKIKQITLKMNENILNSLLNVEYSFITGGGEPIKSTYNKYSCSTIVPSSTTSDLESKTF